VRLASLAMMLVLLARQGELELLAGDWVGEVDGDPALRLE
jgi:hypothetical protein